MLTVARFLLLLVFRLFNKTNGHGHVTSPRSRVELAVEAGLEGCPHCTIAGPPTQWTVSSFPGGMRSTGSACNDGSWYTGNPFCNPGSAPAAIAEMNSGTPFGVCGTQQRNQGHPDYYLDYNHPRTDVYGDVPEATYEAGQVVDVEWCVNADHGGVYAWRLCSNQTIVDWFLQSEVGLSLQQVAEAEACFQAGTLRCDDVDTNSCAIGPYCEDDMECNDPGRFFHCTTPDSVSEFSTNLPNGGYCATPGEPIHACNGGGGELVRDRIRIPTDFPPSEHTLLSYRWDSYQTSEVFSNCADIRIVPMDSATDDDDNLDNEDDNYNNEVGQCCAWWPLNVQNTCSNCGWFYPTEGNYCGETELHCQQCSSANVWCGESASPPTPAPIPSDNNSLEPCGNGNVGNGVCIQQCCSQWGWCQSGNNCEGSADGTCGDGNQGDGNCPLVCCSQWGWCHSAYC